MWKGGMGETGNAASVKLSAKGIGGKKVNNDCFAGQGA